MTSQKTAKRRICYEILLEHNNGHEHGTIFEVLSGDSRASAEPQISGRFGYGDRVPRRRETKIELICTESHHKGNIGENISLGFEVDSVDEMIGFIMAKGLEVHDGPFQPNPHTKFFYVLDPNDLKIQFVENIK